MRDGFIKVAAANPKMKVGDVVYNVNNMIETAREAAGQGVKALVFPELCLTGYSCRDLFLQSTLLAGCEREFARLLAETADLDMFMVAGLPLTFMGKLYNGAACFKGGNLMGIVPKHYLPNYSEFYEARQFTSGEFAPAPFFYAGQETLFGMGLLFCCRQLPELVIGVEICEDLWVPNPPSVTHALAGATLICNPSASDELTTKEDYRRNLVTMHSARLLSGYIYADIGDGESTTDVVFAGHHLIAENGSLLAEAERFGNSMIVGDIDIGKLTAERRRITTFEIYPDKGYCYVPFDFEIAETALTRDFARTPFIPANPAERDKRCEEILMLQASGLKKRLAHTNCQNAVIGLSGGLDSTLALLVTVKAFDLLGLPHSGITAVTMPGFGTTDRTYQNALTLAKALGTDLMEISIVPAVTQHFTDIGQDMQTHDVTYENSQARERTQILMDIANKQNGLVVGTGDMSELALGWATYNGDHMSMYAVNCSVPKTLVRHLVAYYADHTDADVKKVLLDVLDTPVSPELLPPEADGTIAQKTEDIVGPYELHDFFLYYMLRFGFTPGKIYRLAKRAFAGVYDNAAIKKWLATFYRRFFSQQFKRSCVPDGPKVGTVALSPRGDLRMPSDASYELWKQETEDLI